jgi:hypothetical protein
MVFLYLIEEALAIFLGTNDLIFLVLPLTNLLALSEFSIHEILGSLAMFQSFNRFVNVKYSDKEYQHLNENHAQTIYRCNYFELFTHVNVLPFPHKSHAQPHSKG